MTEIIYSPKSPLYVGASAAISATKKPLQKAGLVILALLMGAPLAGCTTMARTPTPFAAADNRGFGYFDQQIDSSHYRIGFHGNVYTSREQVEDSLLLHAANIALNNGFDWFEVEGQDTERHSRDVYMPDLFDDYYGGFATFRYFSPRYGWVSYYDPFARSRFGGRSMASSMNRRTYTEFQAVARINFGHGERPNGTAKSFLASEVKANIAPRLIAAGALVANAPTDAPTDAPPTPETPAH